MQMQAAQHTGPSMVPHPLLVGMAPMTPGMMHPQVQNPVTHGGSGLDQSINLRDSLTAINAKASLSAAKPHAADEEYKKEIQAKMIEQEQNSTRMI